MNKCVPHTNFCKTIKYNVDGLDFPSIQHVKVKLWTRYNFSQSHAARYRIEVVKNKDVVRILYLAHGCGEAL